MSNGFYEVLFRKSLKDIDNLKNEVKRYQDLYNEQLVINNKLIEKIEKLECDKNGK